MLTGQVKKRLIEVNAVTDKTQTMNLYLEHKALQLVHF